MSFDSFSLQKIVVKTFVGRKNPSGVWKNKYRNDYQDTCLLWCKKGLDSSNRNILLLGDIAQEHIPTRPSRIILDFPYLIVREIEKDEPSNQTACVAVVSTCQGPVQNH